MASVTVPLGPGVLQLTGEASSVDFACEVVGASITHEYEETTEQRTRLCGDVIPAAEERRDGFSANVENDLAAAGLYNFLQVNDLKQVAFSFTPNSQIVDGGTAASWDGTIVCKLPSTIGADEYGAPIASSIEWDAVGKLAFTPAQDA